MVMIRPCQHCDQPGGNRNVSSGRRTTARVPVQRGTAVVLAGLLLLAACRPPAPAVVRASRSLMGTMVTMTLEGPDKARLGQARDAAYAEMQRLSDMMSHYDPASVVTAINTAAGQRPVPVPPELMQVLKMARAVSVTTNGAFDITVGSLRGWRFGTDPGTPPDADAIRTQLALVDYRQVILDEQAGTAFLARAGMRIDPGGIAKLYILDAGMRTLRRNGVHSAMLNGGGDVLVTGAGRAVPWTIGIRDPRVPDRLLGVIALRDGIVASSGDYERLLVHEGRRFHHILDPRTGYPAEGPHGVTLVASRLATVNGLGAAIMVLGAERGRALIERSPELEGLIVDRDGSVWMSPGFRQLLR